MESESAKYSSIQNCIKAVLQDDGFHIPSKEALASLRSASSLCDWVQCSQNKDVAEQFNFEINALLNGCIESATYRGKHGRSLNKQRLWSSYHKLTSSLTYRAKWDDLFKKASISPNALLFQFVTEKLMDYLVIKKFPIPEVSSTSPTGNSDELSYLEENALRYVCGYIVRLVEEKLSKSSHSMKEAFLFGLGCMIEGIRDDGSESQGASCSTSWLDSIDRGGLIHVSQDCYRFFFSVEMEVRGYMKDRTEEAFGEKGKEIIKEAVCKDVDVLYNWDICQDELQDCERAELLSIIVSQYISLRGFSFARSLLEKFKCANKKRLQKTKGLRKKVSSK